MHVLILEEFAPEYGARLRSEFPDAVFHEALEPEDAADVCGQCEAIVALAHCVPDDLVARMPKLRWVCALTTGTDHLDTLQHLKPDVRITNARGIHGPQMAEMAMVHMLGLLRNVRGMMANQRAHVWQRWPQGLLLGKTVVLVGVGAIAEEMAVRFKAFGMRVVGVSDARKSAANFDEMVPRARMKDAAAQADFLIALVPYTEDTHHMIDAGILDAMPRRGHFINLARGNVVDEKALIERLRSGRLAGAGLDVFAEEPLPADSPLWDMDNVTVTPRVGGMSDIYPQQVLPLVIENMHHYMRGEADKMRNIVR